MATRRTGRSTRAKRPSNTARKPAPSAASKASSREPKAGAATTPESSTPLTTAAQGCAFTLRGAIDSEPSASSLATQAVTVKVKAQFRPGLSRAGGKIEDQKVDASDVIEIEFADGPRVWMRADEYRARYGGAPSRDANGEEFIAVGESLSVLPRGMQSRGPVDWVIKSLKVLGVDLEQKTASSIGKLVDNKKSDRRPGLGLFWCNMESGVFKLSRDAKKLEADKPYLLFIHGTMSSTWGSFGDLWSAPRRTQLDELKDLYGNRVWAFEHETLSVNPVENVLKLLAELPNNAKLHVITHSRGGLVGELLCRANRASADKPRPPFDPRELELVQENSELQSQLNTLNAELKKKKLQVERFVRVACPALGTTLASGRLDRWLSAIGSVASIAVPDTPLGDFFKDIGDFVAAVVHERTNPKSLPGLETMMPESPFIRLVNSGLAPVPGDIAVIAGDIEPDAWWAKVLVWLTDRFYQGDHDLVVNTESMRGGAEREGKAVEGPHKGPKVHHFSYFANDDSARQVVRAVTGTLAEKDGFILLRKPEAEIARAAPTVELGPRPVVFLLPGIMGSELAVDGDHVWAQKADLMFGGLAKLTLQSKRKVVATDVFEEYYGELDRYLSKTHRVIRFPFDWRLPIEDEADRLAATIERELNSAKANQQPIRIIAHSMGGLVARTMIARRGTLWKEICELPGARLVMLGTPNGGSHSITELLVGQSATLRKLAMLDVRHDKKELLEIIARFPGVLAMLPKDPREDYFTAGTWNDYHAKTGDGWVVPEGKDLTRAREFRDLIDSSPLDKERVVYVAGQADATLAEMFLDTATNKIKFKATVRGDGRVTWDSGIPQDIHTWYLHAEHGDMPACEDAFPAFQELLESGRTALLPETPPVSRAAGAELFDAPEAADELYPDQDQLQKALVGASSARRRTQRRAPPVRVSVLHGDLAFASFPVAVGHYIGDTIVSAEAALDRALKGELTHRHQLGLYPGEIETCSFILHPDYYVNRFVSPPGAVVVGLGAVGSITARALTRSFARALLDYVVEWRECTNRDGNNEQNTLGVSALLIGTHAGGVDIRDSVQALLRGVLRANEALAGIKQASRIDAVEFIELFEDRAIQAIQVRRQLEDDPELRGKFSFAERLLSCDGGLRRTSFTEPGGWWQRVQILGGAEDADNLTDGSLRFLSITRRARNELRLQSTQRKLVDNFVSQAIRSTTNTRATAVTLFELLLPNDLKDQMDDQDHILLMVDEESARYPWELLQDRRGDPVPPATKHGLLRQLQTHVFRQRVQQVTANHALVIGDPISKFPELKGARNEAEEVRRALHADGQFQVEACIGGSSSQVMQALFARDYRVLHLAGHGVYQYTPPVTTVSPTAPAKPLRPVTGMVIGDDVFLTPVEVQQMREVPELVFINCCHLGRIEPGKPSNERSDYNFIAANLATEFIRMGVRAVIAAGWAVDDAAAATFATTFYKELLGGERFGLAVLQARKQTYARHGNTNSWGAYQCYGDPDYRLVRNGGSSSVSRTLDYSAPVEALTDIDNVRGRLSTQADEDSKPRLDELKRIVAKLEELGWTNEGRLCIALARAYGTAEEFDTAVKWYKSALEQDPSSMSGEDIQELANLTCRATLRTLQNAERTPTTRATRGAKKPEAKGFEESIELLNWLMGVPGKKASPTVAKAMDKMNQNEVEIGRTPERLALLGSLYKRKAWMSGDPLEDLGMMTKHYEEAFRLSTMFRKSNLYALTNQLFGELEASWFHPKQQALKMRSAAMARLPEVRDLDRRQDVTRKSGYWSEVTKIDTELLLALYAYDPEIGSKEGRRARTTAQNQAEQLLTTVNQLAQKYREAKKRGSRRTFASTRDQIEFLLTMAEKGKSVPTDIREALRALTKQIG